MKSTGLKWRLQWQWYLVLGLLIVAGVSLIVLNPPLPALERVSRKVRPDMWARFIGIYLVSIVLTHIFVFYCTRGSRLLLALRGEETPADMWSAALVGLCESIMYPMAFLLGEFEFIGLWLAVKVAGQWVRWRGEAAESGQSPSLELLNEGRRRFNGFLVGNALSIMASFATFAAMRIWALT